MKRSWKANDQLIELRQWSNLDPDPRIDKMIITSRIEEIRRNADFIHSEILVKRVEDLSYGEILALERALHRMIEAMLDICRHLVSIYSLTFSNKILIFILLPYAIYSILPFLHYHLVYIL